MSAHSAPALSLSRLKLEGGATAKSGARDRLGHVDTGQRGNATKAATSPRHGFGPHRPGHSAIWGDVNWKALT